MNNENTKNQCGNDDRTSTQPVTVTFESVCGCYFALTADDGAVTMTVASGDTALVRRIDGADRHDVGTFLSGICVAAGDLVHILDAGHEPMPRRVTSENLGIEVELAPLGATWDVVRLKATVLSDDFDSLDYCHVGVTVDMSVADFDIALQRPLEGLRG